MVVFYVTVATGLVNTDGPTTKGVTIVVPVRLQTLKLSTRSVVDQTCSLYFTLVLEVMYTNLFRDRALDEGGGVQNGKIAGLKRTKLF